MKAPNGWFANDLIIWNDLNTKGFVSKGYILEVPDLRQASDDIRNNFHNVIRRFLHTLEESTRAQIYWSVDSDYKNELIRYREVTETKVTNSWTRHTRNERFNRYWQRMQQGTLRRERLYIYLSKKITVNPPSTLSGYKLLEHNRKVIGQLVQHFEYHYHILHSLFDAVGCRVIPMKDEDHFRHFARVLNPSYATRFDYDPINQFHPNDTIQQNCWNSGCQGGKNFGFFHDGFYHNLILLKRRPQRTRPGIIHHLTDLPFLDYSITVNLYPKNIRKTIDKEEKSLERVRGSYLSEGKHSLLTAIKVKETKITNLSQGDSYPFDYDFFIHVWASSEEQLISRTRQIEAAVNAMDDAQCWTTNISSAACTKNTWFQSWPGWLWGKYSSHADDGLDTWLADLLPFSSTFTGHLDDAEALYDGTNGNLIGVKNFISGTPQLAVLLGMTRAGKSAYMSDLLSQSESYYDFTLIVEEGLSYGIWTQTQESQPIIVQPDGNITLNYLDTQGAPLTQLQITTAAALVAKMAGNPVDEDKRNLRLAQISQYIEQLYVDSWEEWSSANQKLLPEIARKAAAVYVFQKRHMSPGATFLEAWTEFNDLLNSKNLKALAILENITEVELTRFLKNPETEVLVRNAGFAYYKTNEYPTHDMLQQMMLVAPFSEHKREDIDHLATLLAPWNQQKLINGASTVSLTGRVAHFELGYIAESNKQLKEIAGFLIANYGRQHIITLPRRTRKRVIFEEVARTLDVQGGEQLVSEFYAQLSKFNTWIVSIVQQYSRFKNSKIRPIVIGNAKQFFFTKMNDRKDLDDVAHDIDLSETTRETIARYPLPEHLPSNNKYASLTYYHLDAKQPLCGTIQNRVSKEMLYCSSSTGEDFDKRASELKSYNNILEGIIAHA
jgi:hypothetical protein